MIIKVKKVDGLIVPKYANPEDAGADVVATSDPIIVGQNTYYYYKSNEYRHIDYIEYETNLYIKPELDIFDWGYPDVDFRTETKFFVDLRPRSSISKYNLLLCNTPATIDNLYRGMIKVRFKYIFQPSDLRIRMEHGETITVEVDKDKIYKKGDKICQMIPMVQNNIVFEVVDELDNTVRGDGGFGSSGS